MTMREAMERRLNEIEDLLYVVKNWWMAKRIQTGETATLADIRKRVISLFRFPGLTREQVRQVRACYYPYKVSTIFHREMLALTGAFQPDYIPEEMYHAYIDPYLNSREKAPGLEDKCMYYRLFPGIRQPEVVAFRINGFWLTPELALMTEEEAFAAAERCGTVFVKQAVDSCGGHGVVRVQAGCKGEAFRKDLEKALKDICGDVLLQKPVRQHKDLARLHPSSVNTYRIITLLGENGAQLQSAFVRFGTGGAAVDNFMSGGLVCGIDEEGKMKRFAYSHSERFETHPVLGFRFEGYALPAFAEAVEMVKKAHPMLPCYRLIFWDVAVDENGDPLLIEANLIMGGIEAPQITNGPLFTGSSRSVIEEALRNSDFPRYRHSARR